eukprot:gene15066-biopygen13067
MHHRRIGPACSGVPRPCRELQAHATSIFASDRNPDLGALGQGPNERAHPTHVQLRLRRPISSASGARAATRRVWATPAPPAARQIITPRHRHDGWYPNHPVPRQIVMGGTPIIPCPVR